MCQIWRLPIHRERLTLEIKEEQIKEEHSVQKKERGMASVDSGTDHNALLERAADLSIRKPHSVASKKAAEIDIGVSFSMERMEHHQEHQPRQLF